MSGIAGGGSTRQRTQTVLFLVGSVVVVPLAAAGFGVEPWQCLLLAGIAAVAAAAIRYRPQDEEPVWSPEPLDLGRDQGARRDVARLSWSVSDAQVGRLLRLRVRGLAGRRLARLGVDLDDAEQRPAAVELLGAEAVRILDLDLRSPVPMATFDRAVRAIDQLDARLNTHPDPGARPVAQPEPHAPRSDDRTARGAR